MSRISTKKLHMTCYHGFQNHFNYYWIGGHIIIRYRYWSHTVGNTLSLHPGSLDHMFLTFDKIWLSLSVVCLHDYLYVIILDYNNPIIFCDGELEQYRQYKQCFTSIIFSQVKLFIIRWIIIIILHLMVHSWLCNCQC